MKTEKFEVLREHLGDKRYAAGDTRDIAPADAANLVLMGVLRTAGEKAEPALKNKMDPAPANKGRPPATKKS